MKSFTNPEIVNVIGRGEIMCSKKNENIKLDEEILVNNKHYVVKGIETLGRNTGPHGYIIRKTKEA